MACSHVESIVQDQGRMDDDVYHSVHVGNFSLVKRAGDGDIFRSATFRTYTALVLDDLLVDRVSKQDVRWICVVGEMIARMTQSRALPTSWVKQDLLRSQKAI